MTLPARAAFDAVPPSLALPLVSRHCQAGMVHHLRLRRRTARLRIKKQETVTSVSCYLILGYGSFSLVSPNK